MKEKTRKVIGDGREYRHEGSELTSDVARHVRRLADDDRGHDGYEIDPLKYKEFYKTKPQYVEEQYRLAMPHLNLIGGTATSHEVETLRSEQAEKIKMLEFELEQHGVALKSLGEWASRLESESPESARKLRKKMTGKGWFPHGGEEVPEDQRPE